MLFSYDWLSQYVELPPGAGGAREVAGRLTAAGLAVDTVEEHGDDVRFDVDVTTNRPDAMCHLGLAREAAALLGRPLTRPPADPARAGTPAEETARVVIDDPAGCPRYTATVIRGVEVGPSPPWLRSRLESIGLRPINNVVDVTNFVLWETGQPLHAFDLAKIAPGPDSGGRPEIRVRRARAGEELATLDGERRKLDPEMLVIADGERPVALAGVMGGLDSEVTEATRDVLLESAHFAPKAVRRAASGLGLHTDASHRFERGTDPEAPLAAAGRAAALIAEVAGGTVAPGAIDALGTVRDDWPPRGRLELARLVAFGGVEIDPADVERWLSGLGFAVEPLGGDGGGAAPAWRVTVPSWRWYDFDLRRPDGAVWEQDLYEEVLRLHGFDAIPSALPAIGGSDGPRTPEQERREHVRDHLAGCGFAEAIQLAFIAREEDAALPALPFIITRDGTGIDEVAGAGDALALSNPLSERYAVLRRSLLPGLAAAAGFNRRRGAEAVRLFEIGNAFFPRAGASAAAGSGRARAPEELPVVEVETVGIVAGGAAGTPWDRPRDADLFALKGVVESLGESLGTPLTARPAELPGLIAGSTAELLTAGGELAGYLGRLDPASAPEGPGEGFALYAAELIASRLGTGSARGGAPVELPSRYPTVAADLTLTHAASVAWADLAAAVEEARPPHLVEFGLKDRYTGEGVPAGAVNTTLGFLYGSRERSLTQDEVNAGQQALAERLRERFGWSG